MAPSLYLLLLLLRLCPASASDCEPRSISNLSCFFNHKQNISCEWATDRTDECSMQAHNVKEDRKRFVPYKSSCILKPRDARGRRTCSMSIDKTVKIMNFHVLSLKLSCAHMPQSLDTWYKPWCHTKLDAPDAPVVNGSSLSWTKASRRLTPQYELQWTRQHLSWADGWSRREDPPAELQNNTLVLGQRYSARVRVQVRGIVLSEWSEWSPTLSWVSTVGRSQEPPNGSGRVGAEGVGLWTSVSVVVCTLGLMLFCTSRGRWVHKMKVVKGALSSSAPSALKMGWQPPLFSSDSYLTFLKPMDIIASVELLPPEPRPVPDCLLSLDDNPSSPSRPLRFSLSSFSNPSYSQLCPQQAPNSDPEPTPQSSDPQSDPGLVSFPPLDLLELLRSAQQSQGVPVVCEYERVEAVGAQGPGGDRVRLTSVDSGVGSGEEVSQDSLHLEEHSVGGLSSFEEKTDVSTQTTGLLSPAKQMP